MPYAAASESEIESALATLPGWVRSAERITKTFRFASFAEAFGWMTSVAIVAEKLDHHPEWRNVWATVEVELTTHDAKGLSRGDFLLAAQMDALAAGRART